MSDAVGTLDRVEELGQQLADELACLDTTDLTLDELARARTTSLRLRGTVDVFDIDLARRARDLRPAGGSHDVDQAMNPNGRAPATKANADTTRAGTADAIPELDDGIRQGTIPTAYLDVIARARRKLRGAERDAFDRQGDDLCAAATKMDLHRFTLHVELIANRVRTDHGAGLAERQHRDRSAKQWDDASSGMRNTFLSLDPETGAKVHDAVHAQVERLLRERRDSPDDTRTLEQITADAIVQLILSGNEELRPGSTELVVLVDYLTLVNGLHDASVHETWDGTPLTPDVIRRIACDTHIIPIVMGEPSELLDAGRSTRTANRSQRRALRAIYRTCAIEGCTTPFHQCDVHHIVPWWQHGLTDLENLLPLCCRHHHMIHETGWQLRLDPASRQLTIIHPDGRTTIQPPPDGLTPPQPATATASNVYPDRSGGEQPAGDPDSHPEPPGERDPEPPACDRSPGRTPAGRLFEPPEPDRSSRPARARARPPTPGT
jgi:hypothetical protein